MKRTIYLLLSLAFTISLMAQPAKKYVLVIHGGAGTILQSSMTPEREALYKQGLQNALNAGNAVLKNGGAALDAVEAAIKILEDDSLFNAGKGAVFTNAGKNELDASIMDGKTLKAGAVAGVTNIKNPITAARAVMDKSEHVMMAGKGAEEFAAANGCTVVDPSYFFTASRWSGLLAARREDSLKALHKDSTHTLLRQPGNYDYKYGTVGAVALDIYGNLAAATSTGGMTNKRFGRIGDSPVIGAGTYADNNTCAISCTGWGEFFIRLVMAKTISDRMEFAHQSLKDAADEMIMKKLPALGGDGGLIGIDKEGNIVMSFDTDGMYRGYVKSDGETGVEIYK
ncbi:isoaspartyl peptidase/L-asparaginase family protein [Parafilimonas sp.]|uniref:isoaspartyl peptidase/L-asparaginase family protein n=1 Tax=Parafilimonas sp. TaxID=1969739 RepID=UPI0039E71AD6